jgi:MYXO-CTERM domain-containing protein
MVEIIKAEYGSAGANLISDDLFDLTLARMDELLETAATVEIQAPTEVDLTVGLSELAVTITNNTGHKLPSGYSEGRVMWIEVLAEYAGERVWSSGAWDQTSGIEQDDQLRTYDAVGEQLATGTTFHLLLNDHWRHDTRIPPLGLQPNIETDPVGDRYELTADNVWPHWDSHAYAFPAANEIADATPGDPEDDALEITVSVRYLINTNEYIEFLAGESTAGEDVAALFEAVGGATPVTLGQATVSIPITAFGTIADTTGSSSGGPASSSDSGDMPTTTDVTTSGPSTTAPTTAPVTSGSEDSGGSEGGATGGNDGCGCRSGNDVGWSWLSLLGIAALRRRRFSL